MTMNLYCMKTNYVLVFLIVQDKEKTLDKIMLQHRVKMPVKVIQVVHFFALSMKKQFWLELFRTVVDVVKKGNQEFMRKWIFSKLGFDQVIINYNFVKKSH